MDNNTLIINKIHNIINYDTNKITNIKNLKILNMLFNDLKINPNKYHKTFVPIKNLPIYLSKSTIENACHIFEFVTYNSIDIEVKIKNNNIKSIHVKPDRYNNCVSKQL